MSVYGGYMGVSGGVLDGCAVSSVILGCGLNHQASKVGFLKLVTLLCAPIDSYLFPRSRSAITRILVTFTAWCNCCSNASAVPALGFQNCIVRKALGGPSAIEMVINVRWVLSFICTIS
jgi:hypothetical protein